MTTYFIGLGPRGDRIQEADLMQYLNSSEELGAVVQSVRCRGSCAFATLNDGADGEKFREAFDGKNLQDCRLSVQPSRDRNGGGRGGPGAVENDGLTVFIGLGPQANSISDEALKGAMEAQGTLSGEVRRRGQCAFADYTTVEAANRAVEMLHGTTLGDCRLAVQISRRDAGRRSDRRGGGDSYHRHGRGEDDDRRKRGRSDSRRRRSHSRDRRRRRSDSNDSRDRRRRRSDSRDRRDRRERRSDRNERRDRSLS